MNKSTIKPVAPSMSPGHNEKWKTCVMCSIEDKTCELKYDAGRIAEPTVGETFTGATSGDTGVVTVVQTLISGTWVGSDATGYITLDTLTGDDGEQLTMFQDNEAINGSTTGDNCLTADGEGQVNIDGIFYPRRLLVKLRGKWLCQWHYRFRTKLEHLDEQRIDVSERERGKE